jgi:hypothetical protein
VTGRKQLEADLSAAEARAVKAREGAPGSWAAISHGEGSGKWWTVNRVYGAQGQIVRVMSFAFGEEIARFIAAAVDDVPRLVALVREHVKRGDEAEAKLERTRGEMQKFFKGFKASDKATEDRVLALLRVLEES